MYVYIQSENNPPLYTVGHYAPDGRWLAESDHANEALAAARVHYLNGGIDVLSLQRRVERLERELAVV